MQTQNPIVSSNPGEKIDLRYYWNVISRYKWSILGLSFAITLAVIFLVFSMRPVYRATTTLLIDQGNQSVINSVDDMFEADTRSKEYLATQFEILKSRDLAARVVRQINLASHPDYAENKQKDDEGLPDWLNWRSLFPAGHAVNPLPSDELKFNALVDNFKTHVDIVPVKMTQLVQISFESHDPMLAATVANTMAREYINGGMEVRVSLTEQAAGWLSSRLGILKSNLEASAKKLQDYREQNKLVDSGGDGGIFAISSGELRELNQRLIDAQFKLTQVARRYGPKHPDYVQADLELKEAQRAYNDAQANAIDLSNKQFKLQELEREVETNRGLYDAFFKRIKEANESVQLERSNVRVVDPAIVPSVPVKPKKGTVIGISFILSLFFGVALALLLDFLDATLKGPEDIERKLGLSMLGMVPMVQRKRNQTSNAIFFLDPKEHGFAEAVRTVRTSVVLSGIDRQHKTILMTSSVPGEGKTTTSLNLAVALAQMERVLLIDADMRKPSIGKALGISGNAPGLANVVAGTAELEDCILHVEDANIDVLSAGLIPPNPLELLSSHRFQDLLADLTKRYDRIVIDSPPALLVSDSLVLSKLVDAVLYVVRSDTTSHSTAKSGISRMRSTQAPLVGVILNKVNMRKAAKYYGAYSSYYSYSYGYAQNAGKKED